MPGESVAQEEAPSWASAAERAAAAVHRARSGEPTTLVVTGEPGMGKSTLLDEITRRATGFRVLPAEALEGDVDPYASLVGWGVTIGPGDPRASSPFLVAQQLRGMLDEIGPDQPVLLRLDDLQWADPESAQTLVALMRRLSGDRLLLAVATRPLAAVHPEWQRWAGRSGGVVRVTMQGLSLAETRELAARVQPGLDSSAVRLLWTHTGGNPLYLTAMLTEFDQATLVGSRVMPAPEQFARVTQERLARLGVPAVQLLRAVVVLGAGWVSAAEAVQVSGISDPDAAVDVVTAAGLLVVREVSGRVELRVAHALLRSAVYQGIPLQARRTLHGRAAAVVALPDSVLDHRVAAATGADDDLADQVAEFGWACYEQSRYRDAARFLRLAAGVTGEIGRREDRWLDAVYLDAVAGDFAAVRAGLPEVRRARPSARRSLALGAVEVLQGAFALGVQILSAAEPGAEPVRDDPAGARAEFRIQALLAWARTTTGAPTDLVLASMARCDDLAIVDAAMTPTLRYAGAVIALRAHGAGAMLAGLPPIPDDPAAVPEEMAPLIGVRGMMRMFCGRFDAALRDQVVTQARVAAGREAEASPGSVHAFLGYVYWWTGQWDLARVNFRLAVQSTRSRALPSVAAVVILDGAGRGDFVQADRQLRQLESELAENPWPEAIAQLLEVAVVRLHAETGNDAARAELLPAYRSRWSAALELGLQSVRGPLLVDPVLAAIWAGDLERADSWLQFVDAGPEPPDWTLAVADWLRALIAEQRGDRRAALDLLRRAAEAGAPAVPFYRAHLLSDLARLETMSGDEGRAVRAATTAVDIYRRLGATSYVDRAHLQVEHREPARATTATEPVTVSLRALGSEYGLSERELDVLTLLAGGLSMKQIAQELFITASTVSFHLGRIYAKTGVHSRHQLTGIIRGQAMPG